MTGATGFLGGSLVRQLLAADHEVVAIVRNPAKAADLRSKGVILIQGDVTEKESMRKAMEGCDGVFHVAGWYKLGAKNPSEGIAINVQGTRNVLELMQELQIPKGVYTSTLAVNSNTHGEVYDESFHFSGTHLSNYDRTKAEAHDIAVSFISKGLPLVILMPGLIYGPDGTSMSDEALRLFLKGKLPLIPKVAAYAWAHVDDVAYAHILAMEKARPGTTYMVCGPNHTLDEAMTLASKLTGKRKPLAVPPFMLSLSTFFAGLVEGFVPLPEMYRSEALRVQAGVTYLGTYAKARAELGYQPRPLEQGLKETLDHEARKLNG